MEGKLISKSLENSFKLYYIPHLHILINRVQGINLINIIFRINQSYVRILWGGIRGAHFYQHHGLISEVLHFHEYSKPVDHFLVVMKIVQSFGSHSVIKVHSATAIVCKIFPKNFSFMDYKNQCIKEKNIRTRKDTCLLNCYWRVKCRLKK